MSEGVPPAGFRRCLPDKSLDLLLTNDATRRIVQQVKEDPELDLQLRGSYVDVYYNGFNVFQIRPGSRRIRLGSSHDKDFPDWWGAGGSKPLTGLPASDVPRAIAWVKKKRVIEPRSEREFESKVIRDNQSPDSPVIVLDRQIVQAGEKSRIDLLMYDKEAKRLVLAEVKKIQNPETAGDVFKQLQRYQDLFKDNPEISEAYPKIYEQKVKLGLAERGVVINVAEPPSLLYLLDGYKGPPPLTSKGLFARLRKADTTKQQTFNDLPVHIHTWADFTNASCHVPAVGELPTYEQWFADASSS